MKAIWTGALGFGLVNIPIKLFSAVEDSALDLDMLDKRDGSNIRFKRVNEQSGKEVTWDNIVKGYWVSNRYVILDKKDLEKASPEKSKVISILQFVDLAEVDSEFFETPYYTAPQKGGEKAYCLLRDTLKKTGKAGLGSFVMREREHLCIIKVSGKAIVVNRIRFAQEIRSQASLAIPSVKSKPAEIKMATQLVEELSGPFKIEEFKDEYSKELKKIITAKSKGKAVKFKPMKVVHSPSKDLLSQLKQSLSPGKKKKAS